MSVKITQLQAENFKRVKAVQIAPTENGLTVLGGNNNQGKTSVLDSIAWALGGDRFRPSEPVRDGSAIPPHITVTLSNGLTVERSGKSGTLKVTDPEGRKSGQQLLNSFVETFALDLPRFLVAGPKDKAQTVLNIIGVGDQLQEMELKEKSIYNDRTAVGRIRDQKQKHAQDLPWWDGMPDEIISASELITQQQAILAKNGENQRKRQNVVQIAVALDQARAELEQLQKRVASLEDSYAIASRDAQDLQDESTEELEKNLRDIDAINAKVRENQQKLHAQAEADEYTNQYDALTEQIEQLRREKLALMNGVKMPLPGLMVENGELIYKGQKWDGMSGSDQLKVGTAIVRALKPACGFVLVDKLEQMDLDTMREFGAWCEAEGIQVIATRVSTGDECSVYIEDGYSRTPEPAPEAAAITWEEGIF